MSYKFFGIICISIFYSIYIYKLVSLNKKSIKANQFGKGNKNKNVIIIERITSFSNLLVIVAQLLSIIMVYNIHNSILIIIAIFLGTISIILFLLATITMKNNWRVGIPEEKTSLVVDGIYKWSRNPAFVGFDLLYISNVILFFNIPLLTSAIFAIVMLHIQILQEEKHMLNMFGDDYKNYKKHTLRYFGRI